MTFFLNSIQASRNSSTPSTNFTFVPTAKGCETACSKTNLLTGNEVWQTEHYNELGYLSRPVSMGAAPLPF